MNILHFITSSVRSNFLIDIGNHIEKDTVHLAVGTLAPSGQLQESLAATGTETFSLNCSRRKDYPSAILKLVRILRKLRIDVIHTHLYEASLVGLVAAQLARIPVRAMTRHHVDESVLWQSRRALIVDRVLSRYLADEIVAPSRAVKQAVVSIDGAPESKVSLIPYGFDWDRIRSDRDSVRAIRRELNVEDAIVLATVGRLVWTKGHEVLFRSVAEAKLPPEVRLLIVGGGPQEGLRGLAGKLNIAHRCIFTGHRSDVYDVISAADVIVHPSLHEAQCQVIIEAMALERPVVATAVGSADEVILPGRTGWIVPPRDHIALARALSEAILDPERARAYGSAGRSLVYSMYPIGKIMNEYMELYCRLLQKKRPIRHKEAFQSKVDRGFNQESSASRGPSFGGDMSTVKPGTSGQNLDRWPLVSVVIPNYNYARFLSQAIDSALSQTYSNVEVIVVDDGSSDGSLDVLHSYQGRVRWFVQRNKSVAAARNLGIRESHGDLVAFLDADDVWEPNKLAEQVPLFDDSVVGMVYCGVRYIDEDGNSLGITTDGLSGKILRELALLRTPGLAAGSSSVVRRECLDRVGLFDVALSTSADWDFLRRIACHYQILMVREPLVLYRQHASAMHRDVGLFERDMIHAFSKMFADPAASEVHALRHRCYGNLCTTISGSYLYAGDWHACLAWAIRGITTYPPCLAYYAKLPVRRLLRRLGMTKDLATIS